MLGAIWGWFADLTIAEIWIYTVACYLIAMWGKHSWHRLSLFWKVHVVGFGLVGFPLDILFNYTIGFMFLELPPIVWHKVWRWSIPLPELLFSSRVQRIYDDAIGWRFTLANFWKRNLNIPDPNHIR